MEEVRSERRGFFESFLEGVRQKGEDLAETGAQIKEHVQARVDGIKGSVDLASKINGFASSATAIVESIDQELREKGSAYEVGYFRVMGNVGLNAGMTLDIHFAKTAFAKEAGMFLVVTNPRTERPLRIPRNSLEGREQAKIRDPETGEILLIDTRSGRILPG